MGLCKDVWAIRNVFIVPLTPVVLLPFLLVTDDKETKCAYVVLLMAVFWITEALPIAATSLLPVVIFPAIGLMSAKDTSAAYINDTSMLFIGGLIVAAAIEHWNIHKRIALKVLLVVGSQPMWLMLGIMLPTWFLSIWINNTATAAMMVPIANAVLVQFRVARSSRTDEQGCYDNTAVELDNNGDAPRSDYQEIEGSNIHQADKEVDKSSSTEVDLTEDPEYVRLCKALSLSVAYAANIGGVTTLTGSFPNIIMKGQTDILFERYGVTSPVTYTSFLLYGLPISVVCLVGLWIWFYVYFIRCRCKKGRQSKDPGDSIKKMLQREYQNMGSMSFGEAAVVVHLIILAILWISRDTGTNGGWGSLFSRVLIVYVVVAFIVIMEWFVSMENPTKTKRQPFWMKRAVVYGLIICMVSDSTPAILVSCSLFFFPSQIPRVFCCRTDRPRPVRPLLPWAVAEKTVPWGVIVLVGGGFALAKGSEESGLSTWLADQLVVFSEFDPWVMNMILCFIMAAATEVTSNTAISTLMMPIVTQLAFRLKVNPLYYMLPTAIATSFAFMLPVATPPNAVVFSHGYVRVIDMMSAGFVMNIMAVLILVAGTETVGQRIFNFHTLPSIFNMSTAVNATLQGI